MPSQSIERTGVCSCGHPADAHELVPGFEFSYPAHVAVVVDGRRVAGMPDVWVCSGGRLVADPENASPWDFVCGCVLHEAPALGQEDARENA